MKGIAMIFPKIKLSVVIVSAIIFSALTTHTITPKNIDEQLLNLAYDKHEFSRREPFVLSPHQDMITYCTIECNTNTKYVLDEIGTSAGKIGSQIYITNLNTKASFKVGSPDANNWLPSWSPDGSKLAFFSDARGKPEVWIYNLKEKNSFPLSSLRIRSDFYSFSRSSWSPDGKFLYIQLVPEHYEEELKNIKHHEVPTKMVRVYKNSKNQKNTDNTDNSNDAKRLDYACSDSDLAVIDITTKQVTIIMPSTASISPSFMKLSPSGNWLCFNSVPLVQKNFLDTVFDLFALNVKNHNKARLIDKNLYNTYVPGFSLPYLWHPKEDKLVYIKDGKLFLLAFDNHGPLPAQQLGSANSVMASPFLFSEDGKKVLIGASGNKFGGRIEIPRELLYISLDDGNTVKIPLHKGWHLKSIIKRDEFRIWQPIANTITFTVHDKATNEEIFVRVSIKNNKIADEKILWRSCAEISNLISLHNNWLLCLYEDFYTPQNMYRITNDLNFDLKKQITSIDPRLDSLRGMEKENISTTITLPDKTTKKVSTSIIFPKGSKQKNKLPALVIFYPGTNASDLASKFAGGNRITIPNFLLLKAGYVLIFPDVTISAEGSSGNPLQEIIDILMPQIYHANQLGYINLDCLGIMGQSYGGYGTAGTIAKTSIFKAAIALSGLYDLSGNYGVLSNDGGYFNRHWTESCQGRMGTHPWGDLQRYLDNSPYYLANNIKTPLLLIHGEKDYINYIEAEKMFSALQRLDKEAELAIYRGQDHVMNLWEKPAAIDAYKRILDFLEKHLHCKPIQNCPQKMSMLQNKCDEQTNF